ncbi:MAG TPA: radical SAM protein [candidate division Zixibacteria bacterium]
MQESLRRKIISTEKGAILKRNAPTKVALIFPNDYSVGMANLGFQTIYKLLNQIPNISCQRFFLDLGIESLEEKRKLNTFSLISFSLSFEMDYPNVLKILSQAGIPLTHSKREENHPLVVAGGIAPSLNPEVMAPFFDCILVGEAEEMIMEFMKTYLEYSFKKSKKDELLAKLARIQGVYVPRFYEVECDSKGYLKRIEKKNDVPLPIKPRKVDLDKYYTFSPVTSPYIHFKDTFLIEVGRGCKRGCRFCAAGFAYQPTRYVPKENILRQIENYIGKNRQVGLVGTLVSDYPDFEKVCQELKQRGLGIKTSSMRIDRLNSNLLKYLSGSGMKTLTLAPEVGSSRMQKIINKKIDLDEILKSIELAKQSNINSLKLYFMLGLPFEKDEDIDAMVELLKNIHQIYFKDSSAKRTITLSINPFVPKAHTPFQWAGMNKKEELEQKYIQIKGGISKLRGIKFQGKGIKGFYLQALLSLGNRIVGEGLYHEQTEGMNIYSFLKQRRFDIEHLLFEEKKEDGVFPWEIVEHQIPKQFLLREYKRAKSI